MHIVLDTNIIEREGYFFNSHRFEAILDYLAKTNSKLYVSEIVKGELISHYRSEVTKHSQDLKKVNKRIYKKPLKVETDIDSLVISYQDFIKNFLNSKICAELTATTALKLEKVIQRAIDKKSPFDEKGRGFKDTIIWLEFLALVKRSSTPICLITGDKYFGNDDRLLPDLEKEVKEYGKKYYYFNELGKFLSEFQEKIDFINEKFINNYILENKDKITELIFSSLKDIQVHPINVIGMERRDEVIVSVTPVLINDIEIATFFIYRASVSEYFLELTLNIYLDSELEIGNKIDQSYGTSNDSGILIALSTANLTINREEKEIVDFRVDASRFIRSI
jgi:predicted nucleic acid-binding protein